MSDYASPKKSTVPRTLSVLLALLILLELCSAAVLLSRVISFSPAETKHIISLTQGAGVRTGRRNADGSISWNEGTRARCYMVSIMPRIDAARMAASAAEKPLEGFGVNDGEKVWGTETQIEIFHIAYDETGSVTVKTCNDDKIFAPGIGNIYTYTVRNDEARGLRYTMDVEAFYEGTDKWIPIEACLTDSDNKQLAGSPGAYVDVLELDGITETNTLSAGATRDYILGWRWPFERTGGDGADANDAYDTMLGDLAADNDLSLTIIIRFIAEMDEEVIPTPPPETGDDFNPYLWGGIAGGALIGIVAVLIVTRKSGKEEKEEE